MKKSTAPAIPEEDEQFKEKKNHSTTIIVAVCAVLGLVVIVWFYSFAYNNGKQAGTIVTGPKSCIELNIKIADALKDSNNQLSAALSEGEWKAPDYTEIAELAKICRGEVKGYPGVTVKDTTTTTTTVAK